MVRHLFLMIVFYPDPQGSCCPLYASITSLYSFSDQTILPDQSVRWENTQIGCETIDTSQAESSGLILIKKSGYLFHLLER